MLLPLLPAGDDYLSVGTKMVEGVHLLEVMSEWYPAFPSMQ